MKLVHKYSLPHFNLILKCITTLFSVVSSFVRKLNSICNVSYQNLQLCFSAHVFRLAIHHICNGCFQLPVTFVAEMLSGHVRRLTLYSCQLRNSTTLQLVTVGVILLKTFWCYEIRIK